MAKDLRDSLKMEAWHNLSRSKLRELLPSGTPLLADLVGLRFDLLDPRCALCLRNQQGSKGTATLQVVKGGYRFLERTAPTDHFIQQEVALHVLINQPRQVSMQSNAAVVRAEDALIGFGEGEGFELRLSPRWGKTDEHGRPSQSQHVDSLLRRRDEANGVEDVIRAVGQD